MGDAACRMTEGPPFQLEDLGEEISICSFHCDVLCMSKALPNYREKTLTIFIWGASRQLAILFADRSTDLETRR